MDDKFITRTIGRFPDDWRLMPLENVARVYMSNVDKKGIEGENPVRLCNYTDVYYHNFITDDLNFMKATATDSEIRKFGLKVGDVLITKDSEDRYDIAVPSLVLGNLPNVLCGYHLALIRPNSEKLLGSYLCQLFKSHFMRHYFSIIAIGVTRCGLTAEALAKMMIPIPSTDEQVKISGILSLWDNSYENIEKLIEAKKRLKKALMRQLFSGMVRFKGFQHRKWEERALGSFLKPVQRPIPRPNDNYTALGIRSHGNGTFLRTVDKPEEVMMDTLYEVRANDLIVNITFAWEGAIALVKKSDEGALVSHRFPTYTFNRLKVIPKYFKYVIQTKRFIHKLGLISPGGAGRNRVLSKGDFLKLTVLVPSLDEQRKIAGLLSTLDKEISLLENSLRAFETQKKGLMQKLLTGKIRVKV
jgi:type I restriction enzyme S subunit